MRKVKSIGIVLAFLIIIILYLCMQFNEHNFLSVTHFRRKLIQVKALNKSQSVPDNININNLGLTNNHNVRFVLMAHVSGSEERLHAIRKTWFKTNTSDMGLMLIAGDRVIGNAMISSPSMPGKAWDNTKAGFSTALRSYPFAEYFGKFDDDTYVYTRELVKQVSGSTNNCSSAACYWGYPMKWGSHFIYGQGGAGYILNRDAARLIQDCSPPQDLSDFEDVAVGFCLFQAGVVMQDLIGLHPHHPYQMIRWDKFGHPSDRVHVKESVVSYMNPLTYHYMNPIEMMRMHDDIYIHGFPLERSVTPIPRIIHQFWEGSRIPTEWIEKCKKIHPGWEHIVWNNDMIRKRFPSSENHNGLLHYDGENGRLCNQDFYDKATEKNLLSDIARYEVLMLFGGMHVDADMECFNQVDTLLHKNMDTAQGLAFLEKNEAYLDGLIGSSVICSAAFSPMSIVLMSELLNTDWNQAPWVSAGPMHLTKIIKQFKNRVRNGELPEYLDVKILDSFYIFPFHHGDTKPTTVEELHNTMVLKGSVMDHKWGTTHNLYRM